MLVFIYMIIKVVLAVLGLYTILMSIALALLNPSISIGTTRLYDMAGGI
jgi:hypothetical protein